MEAYLNKNVTNRSSSEPERRRRNRVLPSAEDFYISLTSEQLDMIGRSRLIQDDAEYSSNILFWDCDTYQFEEPECKVLEVQQTEYSFKDGNQKKRVIHPEPELSNPYHIPLHIRDFEEKYDISSRLFKPYVLPQHDSIFKNGWRGPLLTYSAARNSVEFVAVRRALGGQRSDSLFEYVFSKLRHQISVK